jgi:hypothetical protein
MFDIRNKKSLFIIPYFSFLIKKSSKRNQGLLIFLEKATVLFDATRPKPLRLGDAYLSPTRQTIPCFSIKKSEGQKCFFAIVDVFTNKPLVNLLFVGHKTNKGGKCSYNLIGFAFLR